jgi:hypothetical protein
MRENGRWARRKRVVDSTMRGGVDKVGGERMADGGWRMADSVKRRK